MNTYRHEIDGLRALAVLAILLFHLETGLSGGYVGVDIFFVISGFLITSIVWRDFERTQFTFANFYLKRIRRLFPALFVMLFICSVIVMRFGLAAEIKMFGKGAISSILYVANFFFLSESDYFGADLRLNPLVHTWSLSVEEQFYVVFPALLLYVYRYHKQRAALLLLAIALASLVLSEVLVGYDRATAFFTSPSRFWQFLTGSLISLRFKDTEYSRSASDAISLAGILMILASFGIFTESTKFPGFRALLPTVGTALVIVGAKSPDSLFHKLLTLPPAKFLGTISYSLYLWHWPVIVFYKLNVNPKLGIADMVGIFLLSVLLGYLSWRYVEKPTRAINLEDSVAPILGTTAAVTAAFLAFGTAAVLSDGFRFMFTKEQLIYEDYVDYRMAARSGTCFLFSNAADVDLFDEEECIDIDANRKNILLIGDSHAAHFYETLKTYDFNVSQATSSGCRPTVEAAGRPHCTALINRVLTRFIRENAFDAVIVSANWRIKDVKNVRATVDALEKYTDRVIVMGPVIQYSQALPVLLARFADGKSESRQLDRARLYEKVAEIDGGLRSALRDSPAEYYSVLDILCPEKRCLTTDENGIPLQFDHGHLTREGAQLILRSVLGAPRAPAASTPSRRIAPELTRFARPQRCAATS